MPRKSRFDRPSIVSAICEDMACGMSLRQALAKDGMPSKGEFLRWMDADPALADQYTRARDALAEHYAAEIVDIVDTEEDPARARVRMDARRWIASRLLPKRYGDKVTQEHVGAEGGPLIVTWGGPAPKAGENADN